MRHRAGTVADDLHFDMAGTLEQAFDIKIAVAEGGLGLGAAALERRRQVGQGGDRSHAASAAPGDGFHHDGGALAQAGHEGLRGRQIGCAGGARDDGHVMGTGERLGRAFVAKQVQYIGRGADENQPGLGAGTGEGGVFGQEAVAGVHRVATGFLRRRDHAGDVEVRGHASALQRPAVIGAPCVQRGSVVLRMHRDSGDAHGGGGARDADRDLAAVGDQQFSDWHGGAFPRSWAFWRL